RNSGLCRWGVKHRMRSQPFQQLAAGKVIPEKSEQQRKADAGERFVKLAGPRPQQEYRKGRAKRQRIERRNQRRNSDRQGKLPEKLSNDSADKGARNEHGG